MRLKGELCDSAKRGQVCIDDICRGGDITLCGFDKNFYEMEILRHSDDTDDESVDAGGCSRCGMELCDCDPEVIPRCL